MKKNFSFHRIGLMLKTDWIEYKKSFLLFAGLLLAVNLFIFLIDRNGFQIFVFSATMFGTLMFFYTFTGWKVHRSKNRFLTLPANTVEKFVELLIVGIIFFGVCKLIHLTVLGCSHLFMDTQIWFMNDLPVDAIARADFFSQISMAVIMLLFISTYFLVSCLTFRKYPLPLGALILILYGIVCVYTVYFFVKIENFNTINMSDGFFRSNAMIETILFLNTYIGWGLGIATVVLLYVSFLKLKEKQIR